MRGELTNREEEDVGLRRARPENGQRAQRRAVRETGRWAVKSDRSPPVPPSLLDTFRVLASFQPRGASLHGAPWDDYVEWAIDEGLAPMAAYNLQYALAGAGAPDGVKDRLLSVYQGTLNDNVMKLVNF